MQMLASNTELQTFTSVNCNRLHFLSLGIWGLV